MIRILAKEYSQAVSCVCEKLNKQSAQFDVYLSQDDKQLTERLIASGKLDALILIGNTWAWCETFAEAFGLALVYDKFAEKKVSEFCKLTNTQMPPQYVLDKCCALPETFIHYSSCWEYQCACGGKFENCRVYILPDNLRECDLLFDEYIKNDLFRQNEEKTVYCFKLFGLDEKDLNERIAKPQNRLISVHTETESLDSKIVLTFAPNCAKKIISDYLGAFQKEFANYIYAESDVSLASAVVSSLNERCKTVATAESITGGMIACSLVDVPGASSVLYEGAVTYSVESKCKRLGLNPHFVDEFGVVSAQVAREMALSQLKNADFSVATTGFAGPTSDGTNPVGLCFIAIGAKFNGKNYLKVFRKVYGGDRNSIRRLVTNTALFLLKTAITNNEFFAKNNIGDTK